MSVTATNQGTGLTRTAVTSESGDYLIASLPVGEYEISADLTGFQRAATRGLRLQFNQRARIDLALEVATVQETITVAGQAPLLETDTSTVGQVLGSQTIEAIPLNRRDFMQLTLLTPGALPPQQGSFLEYFRGAVQISGAREDANNYLLDGMQNKDDTAHVIVVQPSLDAIAEFKVLSSTYSAEYGHGGGAQVNIITKSGTNDFHGSLFEFFRDDRFNSRNYFAPSDGEKPTFKMNQYGGTLGGPVRRGKLFFFANYEGRRMDKMLPKASVVPSDALRNGDFRGRNQIYDPLTYDPATGTRQPFPNNIIPANRISPVAVRVLELLPRANQPGTLNFLGTPLYEDTVDNALGRVDLQTNRDTFTFRHGYYRNRRVSPYQRFNDRELPGFGDDFLSRDHNAMVSWQRTLGTNKIHELKFGYVKLLESWLAENRDAGIVAGLGINGISTLPRDDGMPQTFISGIGSFGDGGAHPQIRYSHKYQIIDSFTMTRGSHQFKAGMDLVFYGQGLEIHSRESIRFTPNFTTDPGNRAATGDAVADFLLGYPTQASRSMGLEAGNSRSRFHHFYVQDDWTVASRVTLNLGVRYEYNTPYYDRDDHRASFDPALGRQIFPNDPPGTPRSLYDQDLNNFAPRLGIAWRASERTVVRGGYGIFYTPENGNAQDNLAKQPPLRRSETYNAAPLVPNLTYNEPYPASALASGVLSLGGIMRDFPLGYLQQWNVNVQREFTRQITADIGYVGSSGSNLQNGRQINQAVPGTAPLQSRRPFPAYGSISLYCACFPSEYQSLQSRVQARWGRGSSLLGAYTLSKSTDILSSYYLSGSIQNWNDLEDSHGPANFDRRHNMTVAFVSDLPFGEGQRFLSTAQGLTNALIGNWQVNVVGQFASGNPLTITLPFDNSTTANLSDRPNMIGDPKPANQGPDNWIDPTAFAVPARFTFGDAGRNSVRGPGLNRVDLSMIKNVRLSGDKRLQLRLEAFNVLNTTNYYNPGTVLGTAQFGKISQAADGRDIQLGARFTF